ncbi:MULTISPECIES: IS66 family transposase [Ramlibacter]|uniref:IS66 family transposase n=1 Tax=Ramlibacter TaxID=174951 RepID=UPI001D110559|nr:MULTISPECIES: IS66 family transposase [Ramlibacter]
MELARDLNSVDLAGVPADVAALIKRLQQDNERKQNLIECQSREIAWRDAKLEKVTFELARLKRWKFGAKSEAMSAQQRALFEETMAEDEASLQAQLAALKASLPETPDKPKAPPRKPRCQRLPDHLRRVEHRHEPESTDCACGAAMVRVGEDVSERLDIIPAEFFVHRHIYGKWACRCCQTLVQPSAVPELIEGGIAASGFVAHTLISRFVDHVPYYRQETINARSGVHTPRSTLSSISGQGGAALEPLYDAQKRFVLQAPVLHADETPVAMLDPGSGKTKRAYVWAYARGEFDAQRGVIFEFCLGHGSQYPTLFLGGANGPPGHEQEPWRGTLLTDQYSVYDSVVDERTCSGRIAAACAAHARRKFEELAKTGSSEVAQEAIRRFALIYHAEGQLAEMDHQQRLDARTEVTRPMWENMFDWLQLERRRVAEGGATAKAIDYSLNCWPALTRHLHDGGVGLDNNFLERQIKPWQMGERPGSSQVANSPASARRS